LSECLKVAFLLAPFHRASEVWSSIRVAPRSVMSVTRGLGDDLFSGVAASCHRAGAGNVADGPKAHRALLAVSPAFTGVSGVTGTKEAAALDDLSLMRVVDVGRASFSRAMYCHTSSSVQLEIGNTRMCSPGCTRVFVQAPEFGACAFGPLARIRRREGKTALFRARLFLVAPRAAIRASN